MYDAFACIIAPLSLVGAPRSLLLEVELMPALERLDTT